MLLTGRILESKGETTNAAGSSLLLPDSDYRSKEITVGLSRDELGMPGNFICCKTVRSGW
jgi:hypothetical protein